VAVAHTLLVMVYALLTQQQAYHELGGQYFDARDRLAVQRRLVHRLEALGYVVSLQPTATPPLDLATLFSYQCIWTWYSSATNNASNSLLRMFPVEIRSSFGGAWDNRNESTKSAFFVTTILPSRAANARISASGVRFP
jgi:hypothetical protein